MTGNPTPHGGSEGQVPDGPPPWPAAMRAAGATIGIATIVNSIVYLAYGGVVRIPGELSVAHVAGFTAAMIPVVALLLRLLRGGLRYRAVVLAGTLLTLPSPFAEFGTEVGWRLAVLHVIAGAAALAAPRELRSGPPATDGEG